jgi:hypothetical protein
MKFSIISSRVGLDRPPKIALTLALLAALQACVSPSSFLRQANSSLPLEVIHGGSGQIMSFRTHETSDRLYITGTATSPFLKSTTHVDVQLIGPGGDVIAEKQDNIGPVHTRAGWSRSGRHSYVASFLLSDAHQAARIRVIYHGGAHRGTNS